MNTKNVLLVSFLVLYLSSGAQNRTSTKSEKMSNKVKVEIWSDMVCPFCYIGKKKIEQAIKKLDAQSDIEIVWHSFQLDPDFPKDTAISSTKVLTEKKGISEQQLNGMYQNLVNSGKYYNIDFRFQQALSYNTYNAHRLWQWSKQFNKQNDWKEAIMQAYFTEGKDLSVQENLLQIAESIGLNRNEAEQVLKSNRYANEVEHDIYQSRTLNIQGVPYFLINNKTVISGAQDDQVFENALKAVLLE